MLTLEERLPNPITEHCTGFDVNTGLKVKSGIIKPEHICLNYHKPCEGAICVDKNISFIKVGNELSRAALQQAVLDTYEELPYGSIITCRVTKVESYGAFVDIGYGTVGLIRVKEVAIPKAFKPHYLLSEGMVIKAVKIHGDTGDVNLSLRMLLPTFDEYLPGLTIGKRVVGIVDYVDSNGVFVMLANNLVGLAELPTYRVSKEDRVTVTIDYVNPDRSKIKLTIHRVLEEKQKYPLKLSYGENAKLSRLTSWEYNSHNPDCKRKVQF